MKQAFVKFATVALAAIAVLTVSATASTLWVHNPKVPQELLK